MGRGRRCGGRCRRRRGLGHFPHPPARLRARAGRVRPARGPPMSHDLPLSPRRLARFARVAYFLACLGAASLLVRALGDLLAGPPAAISSGALLVWWIVALTS